MDEEELIDLEIEIHETVDKYLAENGIQQCQPEFYKTMVDKITEEYLENLICIGFIETDDDSSYEKIFKKFRKQVHIFTKNYFAIIGIPRRAYQNPRSHIFGKSPNRETQPVNPTGSENTGVVPVPP